MDEVVTIIKTKLIKYYLVIIVPSRKVNMQRCLQYLIITVIPTLLKQLFENFIPMAPYVSHGLNEDITVIKIKGMKQYLVTFGNDCSIK